MAKITDRQREIILCVSGKIAEASSVRHCGIAAAAIGVTTAASLASTVSAAISQGAEFEDVLCAILGVKMGKDNKTTNNKG